MNKLMMNLEAQGSQKWVAMRLLELMLNSSFLSTTLYVMVARLHCQADAVLSIRQQLSAA